VLKYNSYLSHCYSTAWDRLQDRWRLSVCVCVCVCVCQRSYGRNFEQNLMKLCTVVWGRKTKIEFVGGQNPVKPSPILPPNRKIYNGAYGEIKKNLNCHNSDYTQDRIVIFGSSVGFSGTAYLTASSKFTPR